MKSFLQFLLETNNNNKIDVLQFTDKESKQLFSKLNTAIQNIKEKYAKCMAVVNLLDSNGGNLSEKILSYYLSTQPGIKAIRVGGEQALTDIQITIGKKTINMSLKTYNSSNDIDLGSSLSNVPTGSVAQIAKAINDNISNYNVVIFTGTSGKKRKAIQISSIKDKNIKNQIILRINAIIEKLCGTISQPEIFCYIEKIYAKKQLQSFRFNTFAFNRTKLEQLLNNGYISLTNGAYGILIKTQTDTYIDIVIAQAKNQLTISPKFLRNNDLIQTIIYDGHSESISLDVNASEKLQSSNIFQSLYNKSEQEIDDVYINSLLNIYNSLTATKSKIKTKK